ncbi:MAG: S-methyl-5'-thioadenosine phosphorylase, partial [Chloroflexi bacterium]
MFVADRVRAAVIGGSGFYAMEGLSDVEELRVDTPFG